MTGTETRAARKRAGLTQQQCADLMEWSVLTWKRKESGMSPWIPIEWRYFLHVAGLERMPFRAARAPDE